MFDQVIALERRVEDAAGQRSLGRHWRLPLPKNEETLMILSSLASRFKRTRQEHQVSVIKCH
jgi:hypothetical protein